MWIIVILSLLIIPMFYFCTNFFKRHYITIKISYYSLIIHMSFFLTPLMWPYFLLNPRDPRNGNVCSRFIKYFAKFTGLKWELRNGSILSEDRAAVIVANHQSTLDAVGIFVIWDVIKKLISISKIEMYYEWPIGRTLYLIGTIFIDRTKGTEAYQQLISQVKDSKKNNIKTLVFPEGTRNRDVHRLLPFKKGGFAAAVEAQVPIIPIVFSPYHFFTKGNESLLLRGPIIIECLAPESTEGLTIKDVPALTERVYKRMVDKYQELSEEVLEYYSFNCDEWYSKRPVLVVKN